ncbi:MAG: hypothetical protein H0T59_04065 [Chloroflexi bacterium]|nr:hypothetical protein [Chloroflexota bacterium]
MVLASATMSVKPHVMQPDPFSRAIPATPVTTGTVNVPSSIDATGASDASAPLATFLRSVPNGSTIAFRAGGTYRLDTAIHLKDRHNLVFEGNGATLRMAGCRVEDSAFLLDGTPSTRIVIRDFTMIGDNSAAGTTGAYVGGCESQMGVAIYGARDIEITNVTISSVHAECVYLDSGGNPRGVGPWADGISFHDSICRLNGRMGVAIAGASHVTISRVTFDRIAFSVLDIEPYMANGGATYVAFTDNIINGYGASPTYTPWVFEGSAYGMTTTIVSDISIARNKINIGPTKSINTGTTAGLTIKARISRWKNISVVDNVSTVSGAGPTMYFEHADGITVSGNIQALTSGSLVWTSDTTGVSIQ